MVIQCGKGNSYGHPHKETMEKLKKQAARYCAQTRREPLPHSVTARQLHGVPALPRFPAPAPAAAAIRQPLSQILTTGQAAENEAGNPSTRSSYVINTNTGKFHRPDCASATQMKPENRKDVAASRDELVQEGYEPVSSASLKPNPQKGFLYEIYHRPAGRGSGHM